jgi:RecA-family ATPase
MHEHITQAPPLYADLTSLRLRLRQGGYAPIPCEGKRPPMPAWNELLNATPEQIRLWEQSWHFATNTGILTCRTPAIDIDITDPNAADAVEELLHEHFETAEYLPRRIGKAPKRAFIFQTDHPFRKIARSVTAPNGTEHKIEILCDGQQIVVDGEHPETQQRYAWVAGSPADIPREQLTYLDEEKARAFLDAAVEMLVREKGYQAVAERSTAAERERDSAAASGDWEKLVANIVTGGELHDSTVPLALKMLKAGMSEGAAVNMLRSIFQTSRAKTERTKDWQREYDDIPRSVKSGAEFIANEQPIAPLPYVALTAELERRRWLVIDRFPMCNVFLLTGEGGIGKSTLAKQLCGATVLGRDWIGFVPAEQGAALFVSAEEDAHEIRRRMEDVAALYGTTRAEIERAGFRSLSFAGQDAVLAVPDQRGLIRPTPLFERIQRDALQLKPKLIILDASADLFGGKEIERGQTRQFITLLRRLSIDADSSVGLLAHPSQLGISSGSGYSGSTAWHNSVRARAYLKTADGAEDKGLRALEFCKSNYGPPIEDPVLLRWQNGVYVPEPRAGSLEKRAAEAELDHLFIKLLRRFTEQGRNVSDRPSVSYAPARFAEHPEAKARKITKADFAEAMTRLFAADKIKIATEGPPSHPRNKIVEVES